MYISQICLAEMQEIDNITITCEITWSLNIAFCGYQFPTRIRILLYCNRENNCKT